MCWYLVVSGCVSTGLSPRQSHYQYPAMIGGLYRNQPDTPPPTRPRLPVRLAVAQLGESAPAQSFMQALTQERSLVASLTGVPIAGGRNSYGRWNGSADTVNLADIESHLRGALHLAGDLGAQYLFVFGGAIDSYGTMNPLAVFNLTVVGGYLVPGTTIHTEGKISGALLEIQSGRAVFLVSADRRKRGGVPSYFARHHQTHHAAEVRDELLGLLAREFVSRLREFETDNRGPAAD